jgi:hypothetical protein
LRRYGAVKFLKWFITQALREARKVSQNAGLIGWCVWALLGLPAFPYALLHHGLKIWIRRREPAVRGWNWKEIQAFDRLDPAYTRLYVDLWNLVWFLFNAVTLAIVISSDWQGRWPRQHLLLWCCIVLLFPIGRLFNITHALFTLFATNDPIRLRSRSITALLVHYVEVVVAFSFAYLTYQAIHPSALFLLGGGVAPTWLTPFGALDLSFRTAATVGQSLFSPVAAIGVGFSMITYSELLVVLFVTIVSIPRHFI